MALGAFRKNRAAVAEWLRDDQAHGIINGIGTGVCHPAHASASGQNEALCELFYSSLLEAPFSSSIIEPEGGFFEGACVMKKPGETSSRLLKNNMTSQTNLEDED